MWQEGEPSFELYSKERGQLLGSLKKRAKWLEDALNKMEGVSCNPAEGALYAMPRLHLPKKACEVLNCPCSRSQLDVSAMHECTAVMPPV